MPGADVCVDVVSLAASPLRTMRRKPKVVGASSRSVINSPAPKTRKTRRGESDESDQNTSKDSGTTGSDNDTPRTKRRAEECLIASVGYASLAIPHQATSGVVTTYDEYVNAAARAAGASTITILDDQETNALVHQQQQQQEEEEEEEQGERDPDEYQFFTNDFDPFLFIYHLPPLQQHQVVGRPLCIPPKPQHAPKITLVLDLDETLVHCSTSFIHDAEVTFPVSYNSVDYTVFVRTRPYLKEFFELVQDHFEIVIFTASHSVYADSLLNILDPGRTWSRHRVFRDSCLHVEGNYLKELSVLGRDLSKVIIVDNSPHAFSYQLENGIPIESWIDDRADRELLKLGKFLVNVKDLEDVRPHITKSFKLREKVEFAARKFGYLRPFYATN
eukprot:comp20871_c0_seq1/m.43359 comp20871_c0_seq1/g.43359  ORF comp20871_c0_seq1/g.43359 comp20871_c0_seq1/m.43359 type:complete len:389 (-) comp20871_c0_seq1:281-1447(-)